MPNLVSFVDTSNYYDIAIENYYQFHEVEIGDDNFILKSASGILNHKNVVIYILSDNTEKHLSIIRLEEIIIGGKTYNQINKSFSLEMGKGYGSYLYKCIFKIHPINIISDVTNTLPGSFNLWKRLIINNKHEIFNFDILNNRSKLIKSTDNDFLIWGVDESYLEAIEATPWQTIIEEEFEWENEDEDDLYTVTFDETIERTMLSAFINDALKNKSKIKNRKNNVLLIKR